MGVEAARGKLVEAYAKAGIVRGCGSVQLRRNGTFSAVSGDYAVDGRYEYDPKSGRIVTPLSAARVSSAADISPLPGSALPCCST